ncbi:MAG TPA: hypothetical protein VE999_14130 [Gemmataceae bacterium]|nr:hypothetical protein [Gemmataceae bacterium]
MSRVKPSTFRHVDSESLHHNRQSALDIANGLINGSRELGDGDGLAVREQTQQHPIKAG